MAASIIFLIAGIACLFRSAFVEREVNRLREDAKSHEQQMHNLYERSDNNYNAMTLAQEERDWVMAAQAKLQRAHDMWKDSANKLATYHLWAVEDWRADKLEPMPEKDVTEMAREIVGPLVAETTTSKVG